MNNPREVGKGSKQRPTDWDKFSENFDNIFKKKQDDKPKEQEAEPSKRD